MKLFCRNCRCKTEHKTTLVSYKKPLIIEVAGGAKIQVINHGETRCSKCGWEYGESYLIKHYEHVSL